MADGSLFKILSCEFGGCPEWRIMKQMSRNPSCTTSEGSYGLSLIPGLFSLAIT